MKYNIKKTDFNTGIGQYTAYALAHHGVKKIAIADINPIALQTTAKELKSRHPNLEIKSLEMDCSSETSIDSGIAETVKAFGRIDIAVNNAGIGSGEYTTANIPTKVWEKVINLNLNGVWMCQRAQIKQMLQQDSLGQREGRGKIINIASMYGHVGSGPTLAATAYVASKHGVMGLTKADASMYAAQGIRINAMCPGYVNTPLLKASEETDGMKGEKAKVPLGRFAEMEEIADCVVFLASPMASYMVGAGLISDGGFTCV